MPLPLTDELPIWDIGFRWAGLDPDGLWLRYPLQVKDNFRVLMGAILSGEIICGTLCLDKRPPDSKADPQYYIRTHLDDVYACINGQSYSRKLLKWATLERGSFMEWCINRGIPLPEFWYPPGWKLEFESPEYGHPGFLMRHAEPNDGAIVSFTYHFPQGDSEGHDIDDQNDELETEDVELETSTASAEVKAPSDTDEVKLRKMQRIKIACQVIAVNIWESAPNKRISEMKSDPAILNFGGGKTITSRVLHRWLSEVAPPHLKNPGRPPKKNSTEDD